MIRRPTSLTILTPSFPTRRASDHSVITNSGYDHNAMLGDTLSEIAGEKAGIIKPGIPAVVSERQAAVAGVFMDVAAAKESPLLFASEQWDIANVSRGEQSLNVSATRRDSAESTSYALDLMGGYQVKNLPAVLCAVDELRRQGFDIAGTVLT